MNFVHSKGLELLQADRAPAAASCPPATATPTPTYPFRTFEFIDNSKPASAQSTINQRVVRSNAAKGSSRGGTDGTPKGRRKVVRSVTLHFDPNPPETLEETDQSFLVEDVWEDSADSTERTCLQDTHLPGCEPNLESEEDFSTPLPDRRTVRTSYRKSLLPPTLPPQRFSISPDSRILDAGAVDPFRSLPLPEQPFVQFLIHHYFTYFATDRTLSDRSWNRIALRRMWWPMIISDPALYCATLLLSAGHRMSLVDTAQCSKTLLLSPSDPESIARAPTHGLQMRLKGVVLHLLRQATRDVTRCTSDATIGVMLSLAGWEFLFGYQPLYHTHMKAVKLLVNARGGLQHMNPALVHILWSAGHDLALFTGVDAYIEHPMDSKTLRFRCYSGNSLPDALAELLADSLVTCPLLDVARALTPLTGQEKVRVVDQELLQDIESHLYDWKGAWVNLICPFHTYVEDHIVVQGDQICRLGLLCFVHCLMSGAGLIDTFYAQRRRQISATAADVDYAVLKGTLYSELTFWALIMIHIGSGYLYQLDGKLLCYLADRHQVSEWKQLETLLRRFLYSPAHCEAGCMAIWEYIDLYRRRPGIGREQEQILEETNCYTLPRR